MIIIRYLIKNWIFSLLGIYVVISSGLYMADIIDIGIPCLIRLIFDIECPGCGTTRAAMSMAQFDFSSAWDYNKLAFITVPGGLFFIGRDFWKFVRSENKANL